MIDKKYTNISNYNPLAYSFLHPHNIAPTLSLTILKKKKTEKNKKTNSELSDQPKMRLIKSQIKRRQQKIIKKKKKKKKKTKCRVRTGKRMSYVLSWAWARQAWILTSFWMV